MTLRCDCRGWVMKNALPDQDLASRKATCHFRGREDAPADNRAVRSDRIAEAEAAEKSIHSRWVRKGV
jgi:hypothetical protein